GPLVVGRRGGEVGGDDDRPARVALVVADPAPVDRPEVALVAGVDVQPVRPAGPPAVRDLHLHTVALGAGRVDHDPGAVPTQDGAVRLGCARAAVQQVRESLRFTLGLRVLRPGAVLAARPWGAGADAA